MRYSGTGEHGRVKTIFNSLLKASKWTRPDKTSEQVFIQLIPVLKFNIVWKRRNIKNMFEGPNFSQ